MNKELRDKDITVLQAVQDGAEQVHEIREATILTTREINYSLTEFSLEQLGLITIKRPKGREWREVDGHNKNVWRSKQVALTDKGIQKLAQLENTVDQYEDVSKRELIQRIHELEQRQDRLETVFKDFRTKVMEQI